jgi:hypothetical protein
MRKSLMVCGSRTGVPKKAVFNLLKPHLPYIEVVIHGGASGVDSYASEWCKLNNVLEWVIRPRNSNKEEYLRRNCMMIGMSDHIIAFWDGKSRGTKFVIDYAEHYNERIEVYTFEEEQ